MDGFSGDVVPPGVCFVVDQQDQTVVQATGAEVMQFPVCDRRQTDAAVADRSECHDPGFPGQFSLSDVVINHLSSDQSAVLTAPFEQQQTLRVRQAETADGFRALVDVESLKPVGGFQSGLR